MSAAQSSRPQYPREEPTPGVTTHNHLIASAASTIAALVLVAAGLACSGVDLLPQPTSNPATSPTSQAALSPVPTDTVAAQVVAIVDGDTIKVELGGERYTIRYIGIDTPETVRQGSPVEWMGHEATEANRRLVEGQTVYLERDVSETDRYGRLLRYVYLPDGTMVNAELVRQGYAQAVTYPPDVRYQDLLTAMQQEAREAERGLWGPTPTPGSDGY